MDQQSNEAKAGVTAPSGANGASPTSVESGDGQNGAPPVSGGSQTPSQEKPATNTENIGFGDKRHPEYKRFKELSESNRKYKEQFDGLQRELSELKGFRDSMLAQRQGTQMADEQKQALQQLFKMGLSVPEIKDMIAKEYGLDRLDKVHKDFSSFKENWEGNQYESEMSEVLKSAKDLGLDPEEVESELKDHVETHPFFADKSYYKGGVWAAFRDKYWDKVGELRERAENIKKIKEREMLKNGQTQTSQDTSNPAKPALPKRDGVNRNVEIIRQAGGVDKLPFWNR